MARRRHKKRKGSGKHKNRRYGKYVTKKKLLARLMLDQGKDVRIVVA